MTEQPTRMWTDDPVMIDAVFMIQIILKAAAGKEGRPGIVERTSKDATAAFASVSGRVFARMMPN